MLKTIDGAYQGAAGVDGESIADFEKDLKNNIYNIYTKMPSRKRNKGKERKAKREAAKEAAKGAWWKSWTICGRGSRDRCFQIYE